MMNSLFVMIFLLSCAISIQMQAKPINPRVKVYIVYMGATKHNNVERITSSHHEILASVHGSKEVARRSMIYSYRHGFSGFAARMTESQARIIAELPDVVDVIPNQMYEMQTTRSYDYLGLSPSSATNLLHDAKQGDDVIIGVIDSGIWPESNSFRDEGLGPIPSRWKGRCQSGEGFNATKHCNKKVIGARYIRQGYLAEYEIASNATQQDQTEFMSPRDSRGHGTHCASTAAGSFVRNASFNGLASGTARGGAPRARLAIYKVLWNNLATSADILKAFEMATHDGVDVLSLSIGRGPPLDPEFLKTSGTYYGSFHAVSHGITVVCSGGNHGPISQTVGNVAPWIITVAASTIDRSFPTPITLGNSKTFIVTWTTIPYSTEAILEKGGGVRVANPFDFGGGVINPNAAKEPGLLYTLNKKDYIRYLCAMNYPIQPVCNFTKLGKPCQKNSNFSILNLNLPSITIPSLSGSVTVIRTVTNVGNKTSIYRSVVDAPKGFVVSVRPSRLVFNQARRVSFRVTIKTLHNISTDYYFGSLTWIDGRYKVTIPISVKSEIPALHF